MQILDVSSKISKDNRNKKLGDKNPLQGLHKVNTFLNSMARNSKSSKRAYSTGLIHFNNFLNEHSDKNLSKYNLDTIFEPLQSQQLDIYNLFDQFVSHLFEYHIATPTLKLYVAAVRSYLSYFDIDIVSSKFKRRVKIPKYFRNDEQPLDVLDIRTLLLKCTNKRLKAYLMLLASSGLRTIEATSLRLQDIDFSSSPTRITIRKEFSKTRRSRTVYCSDEATEYLRDLLKIEGKNTNDYIFSVYNGQTDPKLIYYKMLLQFEKLQKTIGGDMDARKVDDGVGKRHKITLHSLRRFCKGVISDQAGQDYSEWFLGHSKSPYYTKKEPDRRQIYATKCMKYLTFLDYATLEATGKSIEAKLSEKEQEIQILRQRDALNTDAISTLSDRLEQVVKEIEVLKQKK